MQRYDLVGEYDLSMGKMDDGDYVLYSDHEAALAHERQISDDVVKDNEILKGRIERLRDALGNIIGSCDCCHERCDSCTIHITIAKEALEKKRWRGDV